MIDHKCYTRLEFKFEVLRHPNQSFQEDRDPRERGSRPLNSNRYANLLTGCTFVHTFES